MLACVLPALVLPVGGCTNFVFTGTSSESVEVVREAMRRIAATEESITRRLDLDPEELEMTFLVRVPSAEAGEGAAGPSAPSAATAAPGTPPEASGMFEAPTGVTGEPATGVMDEPAPVEPVPAASAQFDAANAVPARAEQPADAPLDLRTIFVRIVPWGDVTIRQRTITLDAWRWHGVPPMWGGSARSVQVAADQALSAVLAERQR